MHTRMPCKPINPSDFGSSGLLLHPIASLSRGVEGFGVTACLWDSAMAIRGGVITSLSRSVDWRSSAMAIRGVVITSLSRSVDWRSNQKGHANFIPKHCVALFARRTRSAMKRQVSVAVPLTASRTGNATCTSLGPACMSSRCADMQRSERQAGGRPATPLACFWRQQL